MTVTFFDRQEESNSLNNTRISEKAELVEILHALKTREPFFCELVGKNGFNMLLGVGGIVGCAQYSRSDGSSPYMMAVEPGDVETPGYAEFLITDTLTQVPRHFCIPFESVTLVAVHFLETGERSPLVTWEEI